MSQINIEAPDRPTYFTLLGIKGLAQGLQKRQQAEQEQFDRDTFYRCSYCLKYSKAPLPACSLCK